LVLTAAKGAAHSSAAEANNTAVFNFVNDTIKQTSQEMKQSPQRAGTQPKRNGLVRPFFRSLQTVAELPHAAGLPEVRCPAAWWR
jgi:hypothetical protein